MAVLSPSKRGTYQNFILWSVDQGCYQLDTQDSCRNAAGCDVKQTVLIINQWSALETFYDPQDIVVQVLKANTVSSTVIKLMRLTLMYYIRKSILTS